MNHGRHCDLMPIKRGDISKMTQDGEELRHNRQGHLKLPTAGETISQNIIKKKLDVNRADELLKFIFHLSADSIG
jgi:hypothetical protein